MNQFPSVVDTRTGGAGDPLRRAYVVAFNREVVRILSVQRRHPHAEDVAQTESLHVLEQLDRIRDAYPDPVRYARVRARHAAIDHDRRLAVQRSEGARLVDDGAGGVHRGRSVVSGDAPDPTTGLTPFDRLADLADDDVADRASDREQVSDLLAVLDQLPRRMAMLLVLVDGFGLTVTAAADRLDIERTGASKLRRAARRRVAELLGA
jgi:RNA polymerase sigma factor (sigma-70 family)